MLMLFTFIFFVIGGAALFAVIMKIRNAQNDADRRSNLVKQTPIDRSIAAALSRPSAFTKKLGDNMRLLFTWGITRSWGAQTNNLTLFLMALLSSVLVWLLIHLFIGLPYWIAAPIMIAAFVFIPRLYLQHQQNVAEDKFMNIFPDTIDMVVRMLRAGLPITSAIRSIGREASPPVNRVFAMLAEQIAIGIPLNEALETIGQRIGMSDFRFFAVAVSLQHTTGGNLASTLEILTDIMRKRRAVRLKAHAATAEVRLSAYVLGALPFFVIGVLLVLNPGYLTPLVTDPRGNMIVGVAIFNLLLAFGSMRWMMSSITTSDA